LKASRKLALLVVLAALASATFASVFVYYPLLVTVSPVGPPIVFEAGSNANQGDLLCNTITVNLGANGASASVIVHPTYRVTYYKNVTLIKNNDNTKSYIVHLGVVRSNSTWFSDTGSSATLYIYNKGADRSMSGHPTPVPQNYAASVDLTTTDTTRIGTLSSGSAWEVDLYFYIPEGVQLPSQAIEFDLLLIYSPSGETPP